ncbi:PQQ-dependent sugar dehydrogenase [Oryzibacter oryziterrae]|uniref:PQQ-dependent sugar dehydrogenase n=1 Tax=Oryzibacter oryziterrae TaxID=2766474 RepID=UPI001F2F9560|nr:PQQ-dependent sugar dehydrogenase [Oryzibacter oryziterrae]
MPSIISKIARGLSRAAVGLALCALPTAASAYQLVKVDSGYADAMDIRLAPGNSQLLFVTDKSGQVYVLKNEKREATPFIDISSLVLNEGERGVLSMALAPDYATSRRFYIDYVNLKGDIEIDEFMRYKSSELKASLASRRKVLVIPHSQYIYHNGGQLQFDANGLLYISVGDGSTDPQGIFAVNLNSMLGKVLRINPLPKGTKAYQIPPGNPFVGVAGDDRIFAYGLRNPFRFSIADNVFTLADVGQDAWEEVNIRKFASVRGMNFGWPQYEGRALHDSTRPGAATAAMPALAYGHTDGRCAIIGGVIIQDPGLPKLKGRYIYGDFCTGELRTFLPDLVKNKAVGDAALGLSLPYFNAFGVGANNQLYVADKGNLYRIEP